MKISLFSLQKTTGSLYPALIDDYVKRIGRYADFNYQEISISTSGKMSAEVIKQKETAVLMKHLLPTDHIWLLDEKGLRKTSEGLAEFLSGKQIENRKHLVFIIGGPYGFAEEVRKASSGLIRISDMTFTHQMVRLFFCEQLYRAFTIINHEPYHHH